MKKKKEKNESTDWLDQLKSIKEKLEEQEQVNINHQKSPDRATNNEQIQ